MALAASALTTVDVPAQGLAAWPERQLNLIIPVPPGGLIDAVGRRLARELSATLGVPVVPDNRPGAGGAIGAAHVATSGTSGNTLLFGSYGTSVIEAASTGRQRLLPVAAVCPVPVLLLVQPGARYRTLDEFVAFARSSPGRVTIASNGVGSGFHLAIEQMNALGKLDLVHVPYKGGGPTLPDFLAGRVDAMFGTWLLAKPLLADGRARAIATVNAERFFLQPELPTLNERAIPGARLTDGLGVFAAPGTPALRVEQINREINRVLQGVDLRQWLEGEGLTPSALSSAAFADLVDRETASLARVLKERNIVLQP